MLFCRFLATGDSYGTIVFNYQLDQTTVAFIVIEVFNVII